MSSVKAFEDGKSGFYRNKVNPYSQKSYLYREWERGYNFSYFENLEKVKKNETRTRR